jgi:trk system potassium uptake protein TrkA
MAQEYVVIGLGHFGRSVAQRLAALGQSVLVIDRDPQSIEEIADQVAAAVNGDSTDERTLRELGVDSMSCAVVTIGADALEASILTVALLHQLGVPRIIARAVNDLHARVLRSVGAHEVLNPEAEMGQRLATHLVQPSIRDQMTLGDAILAEVEIPAQFTGKNLRDLDIRKRFEVSVMAIKRGSQVLANPTAEEVFQTGDILVVLGTQNAVRNLSRRV